MFKPVTPHEVPDVWSFVEPGIEQVIRRCKADEWTPRDIRRYLRYGNAHLYVRDEGFVVLERLLAGISGEPYLNVWLMWFKPGEAKKLKTELIAWLDNARDHAKCEWWQFSSPRDEWANEMDDVCERTVQTWRKKR